jgi:hypothetical protein
MVYFTIGVTFPSRASYGQLLHQRPPWRPRTQTVRPLRLSRRRTPTFRGRSGTTDTRKASFLPVEVTFKVEIFILKNRPGVNHVCRSGFEFYGKICTRILTPLFVDTPNRLFSVVHTNSECTFDRLYFKFVWATLL